MYTTISVLMAYHQGDSTEELRSSLFSLVNQTKPAEEIILVQDGEVDDSLSLIVDEFMKKLPIKKIILSINRGLSLALNEGLQHCSCEWVARMDSDDVAIPERFEIQSLFIENNPDIDVLGGQITEFNNERGEYRKRLVPLTHEKIKNFIIKRNPINHMTVIYRRSVIMAIGGYPKLYGMEDYLLWAILISKGNKFSNCPEVLVKARVQNFLKRRRGWQQVKSEFELQNELCQLGLTSYSKSTYYFFIRSTTRLIPRLFLGFIYNIRLRSKI